MKSINVKKIFNVLFEYKVPILFLVICIFGFFFSGMPLEHLVSELIARFGRDTFIVLALIIPVVTGMGLNFSIVVGAMAAQVAIFFITHWVQTAIPGTPPIWIFVLCVLMATPIAAFFGWLAGKLLNAMKGAEMIGGLILGYFSDGLYQLLFLFIIGGVIPIVNKTLVIATGIGVKNTIDLASTKNYNGLKYSIDNLLKLPLTVTLQYLFLAVVLYGTVRFFLNLKHGKKLITPKIILLLVTSAILAGFTFYAPFIHFSRNLYVPVFAYVLVGGLCYLTSWFLKTRMGQNMRAVGQNRVVANAAGINVDRTRIIAIIISTVLGAYGQLIYLQNLGVFTTYGAATNVALYAIASLLVGGASVYKATIGQALLGVLLFHTLFVVSPAAGQQLMGNAMIGEYFRVFICYGVIAMALAMHAWKQRPLSRRKVAEEKAAVMTTLSE